MADSINTSISHLTDPFGREITYLRLSVTDRCDFRCQYCMSEKMTFLPKSEVLSLEELYRVSKTFINCGIKKIRLTGGEPLVRKDIRELIRLLGSHIEDNTLEELSLSTNGSQLPHYSSDLFEAGIKRVNVSLDSLDADKFKKITRRGDLNKVIKGIHSAKQAGLQVKINTVLMKSINDTEISNIMNWCIEEGLDLTLIETMPMGETGEDRRDVYQALSPTLTQLQQEHDMTASSYKTGGPAQYFDIKGSDNRLGIITPMSNNFCAGCNRIRLTCTGQLYLCLGQDNHVDFRAALRDGATDDDLVALLRNAISIKPESHDFEITDSSVTSGTKRHMSTTGG